MEEQENKLIWLGNIWKAVANISYSVLSEMGEVCYSNLPYAEIFQLFSALDDGRENERVKTKTLFSTLRRASFKDVEKLNLFTNSLGMSWISIIETRESKAKRVHVLGPVFLDEFSLKNIHQQLNRLNLSVAMRRHFMNVMQSYPVIGLNRFYEYGMMLYYAVTQQKTRVDEFDFVSFGKKEEKFTSGKKYGGSFEAEQKILSLVEEGNLRYREEMANLPIKGVAGQESGRYFRHAKNQVLVFSALCSRSALSGGVDPEVSYMLRERFMELAENAVDLKELNDVNEKMLDTFVGKVRQVRQKNGISPQIMRICDDIALRFSEEITVHELAEKLGYSDYYFTARFKAETGMTLKEYIREKRLDEACRMLKNTSRSIDQISEELGFLSRSYFGKIFKKRMGVTPGEYRRKVYLQKLPK